MTAPEDTPKRKPGPSQGVPGSAALPVADVAEVEDVTSVSIQAAAAETAADDEPVGPVVALLSSAAAVSVYSSMTFHLAMWATALVLLHMFGLCLHYLLTRRMTFPW